MFQPKNSLSKILEQIVTHTVKGLCNKNNIINKKQNEF